MYKKEDVDDLMITYKGWLESEQDTPIYSEMRTKMLNKVNQELISKTGKNYDQLVAEKNESIRQNKGDIL